ncbi:amino-acid N-acetyltransferase [Thiolapillus brandeum]|uniref:Amino-acid acetyltransferase n=1 Tax=Thiolapillus brandeum TaxID=1076588 RepID=A0A7U6GK94_9GAMM|nr:amino-acid N-acetyltransferase [Thiolapillus brandeum]BAO45104.1 N-acetylglutamate synthase [Thiolapillus brandeum]
MNKDAHNFVNWFRQASPYIHAHRGSTVVLAFGGEAVQDAGFDKLIHDIALLHSLGLRLVLVHGTRPQIEERLKLRGADMQVINGMRVTDEHALLCVKEAAGTVRVEIEALLSTGLANSPMAGAQIAVDSGNFVTAKPLGIINGVDYQHTGEVRRINTAAMTQRLDAGAMVLVPPLGYSPTGEVFNLNAADVAAAIARELHADKLVFLTDNKLMDSRRKPIESMLPREVDALLKRRRTLDEQLRRVLGNAAQACRSGVARAHVLPRRQDGVLLTELFTRDGAGTLITAERWETLRQARIDDVSGILALIKPLEESGVLVRRSREYIENEISQFSIIERDGAIIACAALYPFEKESMAELACLVVHPDYRQGGRGDQLLEQVRQQAMDMGMQELFVLTTRTAHWFRERGFNSADVSRLPGRKKNLYNWQRNSRMLVLPLKS